MQRINLGKPYEDYIREMVDSGYYASASEVIRDALRQKMQIHRASKEKSLLELVEEGLEDVKNGKVLDFDEQLLNEIFNEAKSNVKNNSLISFSAIP
jgi:putative addiction module CopG family antidote